jgi:hypothetical protein
MRIKLNKLVKSYMKDRGAIYYDVEDICRCLELESVIFSEWCNTYGSTYEIKLRDNDCKEFFTLRTGVRIIE